MTRGDLVDRIWTDGAEYVDEKCFVCYDQASEG